VRVRTTGGAAAARATTAAVLGIALLAAPAFAATIHVPGDEATIQDAMDAAALFGDTILLADGTHGGAGNRGVLFDKHVTVASASGDPRLCIIDGGNVDRAFTFDDVVSAARLDGVTIVNGLAPQGGGVNIVNGASPTIINCRFIGNIATGTGGGGIGVEGGSSPSIVNCVLSGNSRIGIAVNGGGMFVTGGSTPVVTNCTFSGNSAWDASAIQSDGSGTMTTLVNCIVWGHAEGQTGVDIQDRSGSTTVITYSDIEGGYAGAGNIDENPGFLDPDGLDNVQATPDNDLRLGRFSPATDAGHNGASGLVGVTVDYLGGARFVDDGQVADTGNGSPPVVDMGANERQEDSYKAEIHVPGDAATIQAGIDLAQLGDDVVLADGTYTGAGNRDLLVTKNILVRSGSGNPAACVLDAQSTARGITFDGVSGAAGIQGLTVANGNAADGGGIRILGASPTIQGCRILGNRGTGTGGGGLNADDGSSPLIVNCTFIDNFTSGIGVMGGGAFVTGGSTPLFLNCAFTGNDAWDGSAVGTTESGTVASLVNCIVWGNDPGASGLPVRALYSGTNAVTYSDIQGGFAGTGNINSNPVFADAELRLAPISPCVDAGSNGAVTVDVDYDGKQRIHDGDGDLIATVDMGAFEYGAPAVTGIGDAPLEGGIALSTRPNPARGRGKSVIRFSLPAAERVSLSVYDLRGRRVATVVEGTLDAGDHRCAWDGTGHSGRAAPAGVYFVRLVREGAVGIARIIRLP
jgi:hypothetical protein